jgi:prophage tail gpP-like protein
MTIRSLHEQLKYFKETGSRYWFRNWMRATALQRGVDDFEALIAAVGLTVEHRGTQAKMVKELRDAWLDAQLLQTIHPARRPIGELYAELKSKVLSA